MLHHPFVSTQIWWLGCCSGRCHKHFLLQEKGECSTFLTAGLQDWGCTGKCKAALSQHVKLSLLANPALKPCTKPLLHYLRVWVEQAGQQPLLLLYYWCSKSFGRRQAGVVQLLIEMLYFIHSEWKKHRLYIRFPEAEGHGIIGEKWSEWH